MWAEAAHRETAGKAIFLDPKLYPAAREAQAARLDTNEDLWMPNITEWCDRLPVDESGAQVLRMEALLYSVLHIDIKDRSMREQRRVGKVLRRIGFEHFSAEQRAGSIHD